MPDLSAIFHPGTRRLHPSTGLGTFPGVATPLANTRESRVWLNLKVLLKRLCFLACGSGSHKILTNSLVFALGSYKHGQPFSIS